MDHALYGTWEECGIHVLLFDAYGGRAMFFQIIAFFSAAGNGCLTKKPEENKIEWYETIVLKN